MGLRKLRGCFLKLQNYWNFRNELMPFVERYFRKCLRTCSLDQCFERSTLLGSDRVSKQSAEFLVRSPFFNAKCFWETMQNHHGIIWRVYSLSLSYSVAIMDWQKRVLLNQYFPLFSSCCEKTKRKHCFIQIWKRPTIKMTCTHFAYS